MRDHKKNTYLLRLALAWACMLPAPLLCAIYAVRAAYSSEMLLTASAVTAAILAVLCALFINKLSLRNGDEQSTLPVYAALCLHTHASLLLVYLALILILNMFESMTAEQMQNVFMTPIFVWAAYIILSLPVFMYGIYIYTLPNIDQRAPAHGKRLEWLHVALHGALLLAYTLPAPELCAIYAVRVAGSGETTLIASAVATAILTVSAYLFPWQASRNENEKFTLFTHVRISLSVYSSLLLIYLTHLVFIIRYDWHETVIVEQMESGLIIYSTTAAYVYFGMAFVAFFFAMPVFTALRQMEKNLQRPTRRDQRDL